jgi:hypothetical protein
MGRKLHPIASPEQDQVAQAQYQYQQEMAASSDYSYNGQTADRVARAAWSACYRNATGWAMRSSRQHCSGISES